MGSRFGMAKAMLLAAAASISLAAPQFAAAQSGDRDAYDNPPPVPQGGTYADPCAQSQTNRSVVGGVLGATAGAVIGNSVAHGGGKLGGTLIGGAAGAAAGAGIGHATASCSPNQSYASAQPNDYGPPPPPPAPGSSVPPDDRYGDDQQGSSDYGRPPPPPPPGANIPPDDSRYGGPQGSSDYGPPPSSSAYPPDNRYPQQDDRYAGQGDRYDGDRPGYGSGTPPATGQCQMVRDRVYYPDGSSEDRSVQACLNRHGRWRVVD